MKLLNELCLECSIYMMFFSSSLTVSINALFQFRILPAVLISEFIILFNFSGQLYSIKEKILKQNLSNIFLVCT